MTNQQQLTDSSTEDVRVRVRVSSECDAAPSNVYDSKSLLAEFDDYVASERNGGARGRTETDLGLGHGFEVGDMVWGKVKSHPWWPGHIYNEAFASPTVRRNKREGQVLVAFFGDSSYGWFEPSELIPFDVNFAEKSRQVSSRNFLKAVEEAVEEAGRRSGLGMVCGCSNPENIRPTNVSGYFSVLVPEYEPGVYSDGQIRKARNGFRPSETLTFVREMAMAPHGCDEGSIDYAKNKATVLAIRGAVFEQYDEPYAQAFGLQPLQSSHPQDDSLDQHVWNPASAPLSGPLVISETLCDEKNSTKPVKVKGNSKKDKYLLKRRDEPSNSVQLASREETTDTTEQYIFQKRAPAVSVAPQILEKHEDTGFICQDGAASASKAKSAIEDQVKPDGADPASQAIALDAKPHPLDMGKESSEPEDFACKSRGWLDDSADMTLPSMVGETSPSSHLESKSFGDVNHDRNVKHAGQHEDSQRTEQELVSVANGTQDAHQVKSASNLGHTSPVELKHHKISVDGVAKKVEVHKRPADDLNSESCALVGKKKKKKNGLSIQPTSGHMEKHSSSQKSVHQSGKLIGKPVSIGLAPREDLHAESSQVDASNLLPVDATKVEADLELPQLLGDLHALALDPFHGSGRDIPAIVLKFFLQFRSLVYQKSLSLAPPSGIKAPIKSSSSVEALNSLEDHVKAPPAVRPVKHLVRPVDPTQAGQKRAPSDRQEGLTAKRLKKIKDIKALAAEKKGLGQKASEAQQGEGKESTVQASSPWTVKPDLTRKVERPARPVVPTTLLIKFPPKTSLPSVAELKARFARFGPIDQSGLRVFWNTSTCRVVFLHKVDAQAAYKYAVANQSLFGHVGVRCFLRDSRDSAPEVSEAVKVRVDNGAVETPWVKDPVVVQHQTLGLAQKPLPQPAVRLKSILKKPTGEEFGQVAVNGGSSKGIPRVKFMLGEEESTKEEQQIVVGNRNNFKNASFADGGAPSPVAMNFNSKNVVHNVISQPWSHNQLTKIPQHNLHNSEMVPRDSTNFLNTRASGSATTLDISQQMISLLTRCNDVVTNLTGLLGYVPYHAL